MEDKMNGARLVTAAMLGIDGETVLVGGRAYFIQPPSIKRLAGCGYYLSGFGDQHRIADYIRSLGSLEDACKALSWLISGDESHANELADGTLEQVADAIETGLSLMGIENFTRLSAMSRSVCGLTARPLP